MSPAHRCALSGQSLMVSGRNGGLQLQGVQIAPHFSPECGIDRLVLAHPAHAGEALADNPCGIVVAVAGEVADLDAGVGNGRDDHRLNVVCGHRHQLFASMIWRRASTILWPSASRIFDSPAPTPAGLLSARHLWTRATSPAL